MNNPLPPKHTSFHINRPLNVLPDRLNLSLTTLALPVFESDNSVSRRRRSSLHEIYKLELKQNPHQI